MRDYDRDPLVVIWEVTQACRLACVHCRAEARPRRDPRELSTEEGMRLIDQAAELGKPILVLTGGDPMEREDLEALTRHAVSRGLKTAVSPSATDKVTFDRLKGLKEAGVHRVAVSLDSHDVKTHDRFRNAIGSFRRTMDIVADLRELRIPLQVGTTLGRHNFRDLEAIASLVEGLGAILWSVFLLVPTGRAQRDMMITADECEETFTRLHAISKRMRFAIKTTEGPHYRRVQVQRDGRAVPSHDGIGDGKGFLFVSHAGDVYPSGFLPVPAGNVRREPLSRIYRDSPLFRSLRDPNGFRGKCGVCEYRRLCGGSRARAFAVTGDALASDPLCAYVPAAEGNGAARR